MNKNLKCRMREDRPHDGANFKFEESLENFKRRRALPMPLFSSAVRDMHFFDRMLNVKRIKDFVFITKAEAEAR